MTVNYRGDIVRANTTLGLGGVDINQWPVLDEDIDAIRANILFNTFNVMSLVAQAQLNLDDAAIDAFQDESGVDTGASVNQYFNTVGKFYINQTPVAITNESNGVNTSDQTTYTFSSQALGAAHATRIVAVVTSSYKTGGGHSVSSMTIGGVSATLAVGQSNGDDRIELWWALVPTGTSGDVVITWSAGVLACSCSTHRIVNAGTALKDTLAVAANPITGTIDVAADGGVVAGVVNTGGASINWTEGVTEDNEQVVEFGHISVGHAETASEDTAYDITATISGTVNTPSLVAGSWEKTAQDMTLQSQAFTADNVPNEAHLLLFINDFTSPAYNTDFKGYVSRDGGTTWTQVTLDSQEAGLPGQKFVQGTVDISGQPSGTSMKYKITTHNGHVFLINGGALFWK